MIMARTMTFAQTGTLEKTLDKNEKELMKNIYECYKKADQSSISVDWRKEALQKNYIENLTFDVFSDAVSAYTAFFSAYEKIEEANIDEKFLYVNEEYGYNEKSDKELRIKHEAAGVEEKKISLKELYTKYRENFNMVCDWYKNLSEKDKLFIMGRSRSSLKREIDELKQAFVNTDEFTVKEKEAILKEIDVMLPKVDGAYDIVMRQSAGWLMGKSLLLVFLFYVIYVVIDWILPSIVAYIWLFFYPMMVINNFMDLNKTRVARKDGIGIKFLLAVFGYGKDNAW